MAGPLCGLMLADLGAEVIKVERLPSGDATRAFAPPRVGGESAAFMALNRGKRGVALDMRSEAGLDALRRIIASCDVLVENFRPGTMESMGIDSEQLRSRHPELVYCQITGFGRTGPLGPLGGFDLIAQGYSGLMSITGEGPGRPPVKVGGPITDITAGVLAALGIVSGLVEREKTGMGQRVDTSLFEAGILHTYWQAAITLAGGQTTGPLGSAHPLTAPYQAFEVADGWITVGASNETTWRRLTGALDAPHLAKDPRFVTNGSRMEHVDELIALLAPILRTRTGSQWLEVFQEAGVPAGPVASIAQMLSHGQTAARDMVVHTDHPRAGRVRGLGCPIKLSGTADTRRGAETTRAAASEGSSGMAGPAGVTSTTGAAGTAGTEGTEGTTRAVHPTPSETDAEKGPRDTHDASPTGEVTQGQVPAAPLLGEHTREVLSEAGLTRHEIETLIEQGAAAQSTK